MITDERLSCHWWKICILLSRVTKMTGMTGMTRMTGMTKMATVTRKTGITRVASMTGMTGMAKMTRMTEMTGVTRTSMMTKARFRHWTFHEPNLIHWITVGTWKVWRLNQLGMPEPFFLPSPARVTLNGFDSDDKLFMYGTKCMNDYNIFCKQFDRNEHLSPLELSPAAIKISHWMKASRQLIMYIYTVYTYLGNCRVVATYTLYGTESTNIWNTEQQQQM